MGRDAFYGSVRPRIAPGLAPASAPGHARNRFKHQSFLQVSVELAFEVELLYY